MRPIRHYPFHPILIAAYPILVLYAHNYDQVVRNAFARSLLFSLLGISLIMAVVWLILRNVHKAALISSGLAILFYSYGHFYSAFREVGMVGLMMSRHRFLMPIWIVMLILWIYFVVRKIGDTENFTSGFNLIAIFLVILPTFQLTTRVLGSSISAKEPVKDTSGLTASRVEYPEEKLPDIYYIIMDGYGRSDILDELYNVNNADFIERLESHGFFVAKDGHSNFAQTSLSMASSLNMTYLDAIANELGPESRDLSLLKNMIWDSEVRRYLEAQGYDLIAFETGYPLTTIEDADIYWSPDYSKTMDEFALQSGWLFNEFEGMLLETTALRFVLDLRVRSQNSLRAEVTDFLFQKHRTRVLFTISKLHEVAELDGDHFVVAHIISPHPPFVFGSSGENVQNDSAFSMQDNGCCRREEYLEGYSNQVEYVSKLLSLEIERILDASEVEPIIIIQGDHGPGAYLTQEVEESNIKERHAILNAILLPEESRASLYSSITPVNAFRLILNEIFHEELDLLPDKVYFSPGQRPYDLIQVNELLRSEE